MEALLFLPRSLPSPKLYTHLVAMSRNHCAKSPCAVQKRSNPEPQNATEIKVLSQTVAEPSISAHKITGQEHCTIEIGKT